jgi:hypothetical protein
MDAVVDLEEGLPLEVEHSPENFAGILIGLVKAMDDGRPYAADVVLIVVASSLQSCLARHFIQTPPSPDATIAPKQRWRELEEEPYLAARDPPPKPSWGSGPPSNSLLLPRA